MQCNHIIYTFSAHKTSRYPPKCKRNKKGPHKETGKKGRKKCDGSVICQNKRPTAIQPSANPSPHTSFKEKPLDHGKLNREQYIDLLTTLIT
jgi:hypothetical protein